MNCLTCGVVMHEENIFRCAICGEPLCEDCIPRHHREHKSNKPDLGLFFGGAMRFHVVTVRQGFFPLYEVRDRENGDTVVDYDADRSDMQELADALNSMWQDYTA